jgi:hypothetical protein
MRTFVPQLAVGLPDGWLAQTSVTVVAPDAVANVIVSSEPLDDSVSSYEYAKAQGVLLRHEFLGYEEHWVEPADVFGGRAGWERGFSWAPEVGGPVTQIQQYYAAAGHGYVATASVLSEDFDDVVATLRGVLASIRLASAHRRSPRRGRVLRRRPG